MKETDIINKIKPLTKNHKSALGLLDDAAVLNVQTPGCHFVVTKDVLVEGIHFFEGASPNLIAKKLLRVNLSDLAAMGANPKFYFLGITLPKLAQEKWIEDFVGAFSENINHFGGVVLGGDTTTSDGKIVVSLTALGEVPEGKEIKRSTAKDGDKVFVTGNIGDSYIGLKILQKEIDNINQADQNHFINSYHIPSPQVNLGVQIRGIVNSAADISDGLVRDANNIAIASSRSVKLFLDNIPFSPEAQNLLDADKVKKEQLITAGDDYQLIVTVSEKNKNQLLKISKNLGIKMSEIGIVEEGEGVEVLDAKGNKLELDRLGFEH